MLGLFRGEISGICSAEFVLDMVSDCLYFAVVIFAVPREN